jgi:glutamate synthase domain-containing protein 1
MAGEMLMKSYPRIPSGCAISGMINKKGKRVSGTDIIKSIALMHDRSNGLGGGFAAYGIYPEYSDYYALHVFYDCLNSRVKAEEFINEHFNVDVSEMIPTRKVSVITNPPIIWRYFVQPKKNRLVSSELTEEEYVVRCVMKINSEYEGTYIFSSGKNMGAFKGVGYPEDIGEFYRLDEYKGYAWTAHGRFPTNTPGWWGGAHPFTLLDWSIVHNGEISSYDANRRFLEMYGYKCTLQTDTEAITYIFDFLLRRHGLPLDVAVSTVAAPLWKEIDRMEGDKKELIKALRTVYSSLLVNGPFSIILGTRNGIVALNDRIKLRSLVAATKKDTLYVASEESAIREICPDPDKVWVPKGGEPVIGLLEGVEMI